MIKYPQYFQCMSACFLCKDLSVFEYYCVLRGILDEIDVHQFLVKVLETLIQYCRVLTVTKFLYGLHPALLPQVWDRFFPVTSSPLRHPLYLSTSRLYLIGCITEPTTPPMSSEQSAISTGQDGGSGHDLGRDSGGGYSCVYHLCEHYDCSYDRTNHISECCQRSLVN